MGKLKVFIGWSGPRSQTLALALREWLPLVLHYVEPWVSQSDVSAGERWRKEVASELEATNFGIICLTPENLSAPWVLFEAGALAKSMERARVIPLLYNLDFKDVTGPLAEFQGKKCEESGILEMVEAVNKSAPEGQCLAEARVKKMFDLAWPDLHETIDSRISRDAPTEPHSRPDAEILEELVAGVRGLDARLRELSLPIQVFANRPHDRRDRESKDIAIWLLLCLGAEFSWEDPKGRQLMDEIFHTYFGRDVEQVLPSVLDARGMVRRFLSSRFARRASSVSRYANRVLADFESRAMTTLSLFVERNAFEQQSASGSIIAKRAGNGDVMDKGDDASGEPGPSS